MSARLFMDLETFLITPCRAAPPIVCGSFAINNGAPFVLHFRDPRFHALLKRALTSDTTIVAHNLVGFEFPVLLANFPDLRKLLFRKLRDPKGFSDTLIREKLHRIAKGDPREGFGLNDSLAAHGANIKLDKESHWRLRYGLLFNTPVSEWPREAYDYSLGDTAVRDLWLAQERCGTDFINEHPQIEAGVALALMTAWGMVTDPQAAKELHARCVADLEKDKAMLVREGLLRFQGTALMRDITAARARLTAWYESHGQEVPRGNVTEKMAAKGVLVGQVKVDDEACYGTDDPVLHAFTNYGQAGTLLNKVKRLQFPVIQASYNPLVDTGRTSCRQGDDPGPGEPYTLHSTQVQNPPRKAGVRECIVTRQGECILSNDFDTYELRTWAQSCIDFLGFSEMAKVLRDPKRDVHVELGARVFGLPLAEAYALKKTDKAKFKDLRQVGKLGNFGCPGGLGAKTFVSFARSGYGLWKDISDAAAENEARAVIQAWKDTWPEAQAWLDYIGEQFPRRKKDGVQSYADATLFRSKRKRGRMTYCAMANFHFQGPAADGAKAAIVALMYEMYDNEASILYGCRQLAFIHDEVLYSSPLDDKLHERAYEASRVFTQGAQKFFPDVPITSSPAAFLRWSKAAGDPVFDANGRLIPYEQRSA